MDLTHIPGLDTTEQYGPSIGLVSEAERTPTTPTTRRRLLERLAYLQQNGLMRPLPVSHLENTGGALSTETEGYSATFSNTNHSLAAQRGQEELDGGASANQPMDKGIEIENITHGDVPKRYTILRTCLNGKIIIVDGHTGNVTCTHELQARLYSDVAIKVISLAMDDSDADSGAILVARLLDRFGAEFIEIIRVDPKEWNTEVLFCRELFEGDGSDNAGHIRISRRSQIALLASRRRLVIVDWAGEKMACIKTDLAQSPSKSFIKAELLQTHLVLVERQDRVSAAERAASVLVSLANVWKEVAQKGFVNQVLLLDNIPNTRMPARDGEWANASTP
ncbi:hypothetical protein DFH11DRAFT_1745401 [Phellopilus nigrolimitatus]|nr:hypothetical protein DFH11DRAFT_1745401 [Phellopilus nigrolimitatus]